jgi:hypothetical protein
MTGIDRDTLIYDWNLPDVKAAGRIQFDDETLRDGLQSPSVKDPTLDEKIELVHLMDASASRRRTSACPAPARARASTSRRCRARCAPENPPERRVPHRDHRHRARRRDGAGDRRADRSVRIHRQLADPPVRRELGDGAHAQALARGGRVRASRTA